MYGYVNINKLELKLKEYYEFRGFYCGLCETLGECYGFGGRFSLSYDLTFLVVLLTSLYEPEVTIKRKRCMVHPLKKNLVITNEFSRYGADMNILLLYQHFADDLKDENKITARAGLLAFKGSYNNIKEKYKRQIDVIERELAQLSILEKKESEEIEDVSATFGRLMAEIFVYKKDNWEEDLRKIGFFIGKFIYIMDAFEDVEEDIKKSRYNPFKNVYKEKDFIDKVQKILELTISSATIAFEKLPLIRDVDILRNILYDGIWTKFDKIKKERKINSEKA